MYSHLKYNITLDRIHTVTNLIQNSYIVSKNNQYYARVQDDGNFVVYKSNIFEPQNALWASNSANPNNTPPYHLRMQDDGNLVLYDRTEKSIWCSDTWNKGQGPWFLQIQDDGNLVLYDRDRNPTWDTGTSQK